MQGTILKVIPSKDVWDRAEFLAARAAQMKSARQQWEDAGAPEGHFFLEPPDDEIVCDNCNDLVVGETVNLVEFGRRAVCDGCYQKWYAKEPLEHRVLHADGSIGGLVLVNQAPEKKT